jgi:hypothetical protein
MTGQWIGPGMRAAWDCRVLFVERKQRWWWNAFRESTFTELYGFADSQQAAKQAMYQAIERIEQQSAVTAMRHRAHPGPA